MNARFKMSFDKQPNYPMYAKSQQPNQIKQVLPVNNKSMTLASPMIDRVHKAKPGCSACGKKVM